MSNNASKENNNPEANGSEGIEEMKTEALSPMADLEAKLQEEKNKYLYLYAEFENFKKRTIKERSDLMKFGWENIARELLAVVDNLERAINHMPENTDKNLKMGIEMVLNQFRSTMEKQGVLPITTTGQSFNPDLHEAMGQEPSALPQGTVTQALVSGYTLHGRLLRPAKVVLSTGTPPA